MSMLPSDIRQLTVADRLLLVEELWESIADDESQIELTDAQKAELDRRLAAREKRGDASAPWPQVKRRILGQ